MENLINDDLEPNSPYGENQNDSDNDSDDEYDN